MSSLKELRNRMASVRATQKITRAMQMVAASRLRRAQEVSAHAQVYAKKVDDIFHNAISDFEKEKDAFPLIFGTEKKDVHLLIVCTTERGLCGAFNTRIVRCVADTIKKLQSQRNQVKIITIGKKGKDLLRREYGSLIIESLDFSNSRHISFLDVHFFAKKIITLFQQSAFDVCSLVYSEFKSIASQVPTVQTIIPALPQNSQEIQKNSDVTEYEPNLEKLLHDIIPYRIASQIFSVLLESIVGEMSSRMMAMDNATRNAGDMIRNLSITYNRQRQAQITRELIEIISGAEAL